MPFRSRSTSCAARVRAFAKINRSLRVLGVTADGYHELRTVFQSIALHDTLAFVRTRGPLRIECRQPSCPTDRTNLAWQAAAAVWRAMGRDGEPRNLLVRITKRIPVQAGLGGGSSDAAAALCACAALWRANLSTDALRSLAATLGADVPYFLEGGTAVGTGRGDLLSPLPDAPSSWVVLAVPPFGVSTREAFAWWDARAGGRRSARENDLEAAVVARHPEIGRLIAGLDGAGASAAAMSGSGSAVFGLFANRREAERAAARLAPAARTIVTQTINRDAYRTRAYGSGGPLSHL